MIFIEGEERGNANCYIQRAQNRLISRIGWAAQFPHHTILIPKVDYFIKKLTESAFLFF